MPSYAKFKLATHQLVDSQLTTVPVLAKGSLPNKKCHKLWKKSMTFMIYGTDIGEIYGTFRTYMAYI